MSFVWVVALLAAPEVAVVATGGSDAAVARVLAEQQAAGAHLLSGAEVLARLAGMTTVTDLDNAALERKLEEARQADARFDARRADTLRREVVAAFELTLIPDPTREALAAMALHELAAGHLAEGDNAGAASFMREALRRFPDETLNTTRHGPSVAKLYERAKAELAGSARVQLSIVTSVAGELLADGRRAGPVSDGAVVTLPAGPYRLWLVRGSERSLPYAVDATTDAKATLDAELDARLEVGAVLRLRCERCEADVAALARRLPGVSVVAVAAEATSPTVTAVPDAPIAAFRPWYLLPFGAGQYTQDRRWLAAGVAATEVGLGVWHIYSLRQHQKTLDRDDLRDEGKWRAQRNRSAALFYGSLVLGVGEAVIYGLVNGD